MELLPRLFMVNPNSRCMPVGWNLILNMIKCPENCGMQFLQALGVRRMALVFSTSLRALGLLFLKGSPMTKSMLVSGMKHKFLSDPSELFSNADRKSTRLNPSH